MKIKNTDKIWSPVTFKDGNQNDIISLINNDAQNRGSKALFDIDYWNWKYKNNSAGFFPKWINLALYRGEEDLVIGHYAVIPLIISSNNKLILGGQSVDILTSNKFRNQGVFTEIANNCYKELVEDKVSCAITFPNERSYPGLIKLGWKKVLTATEYGYIIDANKLTKYKYNSFHKRIIAFLALRFIYQFTSALNYFKGNKHLKINSIEIDEIDITIIQSILSSNYKCFIHRSKEYLKWRYLDCPLKEEISVKKITYNNTVVGYYIVKYKDYPHRNNVRIAHIMELILDDSVKGIYNTVLNKIIAEAKIKKATLVYSYSHTNQNDFKAYKYFGFLKLDKKEFVVKNMQDTNGEDHLFESESWFISQGDSDRA